jgi:hypothetical protein
MTLGFDGDAPGRIGTNDTLNDFIARQSNAA